jgi:hypothetical protein
MEISSTAREEYFVSLRKLESGCVKRCISDMDRGKKGVGCWVSCRCDVMEVEGRRWTRRE